MDPKNYDDAKQLASKLQQLTVRKKVRVEVTFDLPGGDVTTPEGHSHDVVSLFCQGRLLNFFQDTDPQGDYYEIDANSGVVEFGAFFEPDYECDPNQSTSCGWNGIGLNNVQTDGDGMITYSFHGGIEISFSEAANNLQTRRKTLLDPDSYVDPIDYNAVKALGLQQYPVREHAICKVVWGGDNNYKYDERSVSFYRKGQWLRSLNYSDGGIQAFELLPDDGDIEFASFYKRQNNENLPWSICAFHGSGLDDNEEVFTFDVSTRISFLLFPI